MSGLSTAAGNVSIASSLAAFDSPARGSYPPNVMLENPCTLHGETVKKSCKNRK
jgi:hypothetical protein